MKRMNHAALRVSNRPLLWLAVIAAAATLTACNTTEGVGRDVKSLGKGVEESARDNK